MSAPAPGAWGSLGYDAVYGPGRDNWNLSLFKSFTLSEARGSRLEFRFETFNTFTSGTFGQISSAADPRTLQLGLKLYF